MWGERILFVIYIITEISAGNKNKLPLCDNKKLIDFLAEVQVIDPESIIKQATLNNLEHLCKTITKGLENTHSYLRDCEPPFQKDLYLQLIKGVDSLHHKLCKKNGNFIEAFKKYHPCCHSTNYNSCTGPADWVEDSNATKICSAYSEISHCYYDTTLQHCGEEAGKMIKELFDAVVASVLTVNCSSYKTEQLENAGKKINNSFTIKFYFIILYFVTLL